MRNEIHIDKLGRPVNNKVIVQVTDIFDGFKTDGGIDLVNFTDKEAWADSEQFNLTEFIPRFGVVVKLPYQITSGTMDYETKLEVKEGDLVYWNVISFKEHIPLVVDKKKYLLVDYHDILIRIRNNKITPVNGNAVFRPVPKKETVLKYTKVTNVTERWELAYKPEQLNKELVEHNEFTDIWEVGDIVHLAVRDKPFKIEGSIRKMLKEDLYAVPLRMVLCAE